MQPLYPLHWTLTNSLVLIKSALITVAFSLFEKTLCSSLRFFCFHWLFAKDFIWSILLRSLCDSLPVSLQRSKSYNTLYRFEVEIPLLFILDFYIFWHHDFLWGWYFWWQILCYSVLSKFSWKIHIKYYIISFWLYSVRSSISPFRNFNVIKNIY